MPRPADEPRLYHSSLQWIPDYTHFSIEYGSPLRLELFELTNKMLQSENYGKYKTMKYEDARKEMKTFLEKNNLSLNPVLNTEYDFFLTQMSKTGGRKRNKHSRKTKKNIKKRYAKNP